MVYLFLYQILPPAFLWISYLFLEKNSVFKKYSILLLFILGTILQIFFCLCTAPSLLNPDSYGFYLLSRGMEHDLHSILYRPKLYPFFLSFFSSLEWALVAQGFLKIGIGALIWTLGKFLKWRAATLAFILTLFLFNAFWLQEPLRILDTTLFTFLWTAFLTLAVMIFSKLGINHNQSTNLLTQFLGLCLLAGLTSLGRQLADLSMFILLCSLTVKLITKNKLPRYQIATCLFLGLSLSMVGAGINLFKVGTFKRSIALGVSLYTHESQYELADSRSSEWDYVSLHAPEIKPEFHNWNINYTDPILWSVNAIPHRLERKLENEKSNLDSVEKISAANQELSQRVFNWAYRHPRFYIYSVQNELKRMLFKCEEYYPESVLEKIFSKKLVNPLPKPFPISFPDWALRIERGFIYQPLWLLIAFAMLSLIFYRNSKSLIICLLLPIVLYIVLIAFIQLGFTRYTLPVLPGLWVLCGEVIENLRKKLKPLEIF